MPDTDLSDIGDVLAARFAEIGVDPDSDQPLNLPSNVSTDSPADDLVAHTVEAGETHEPEAPAQTPPAAAPTPAAPAITAGEPTEQPSAPPAVMAYLRDKYGEDFSKKYQSDEAFLQGVLNLNKKIGERDEEAQLGRVLRDDPARVAQWLRQQRPDLFPAPQAPPPQPTNGKPADPSEFSPEWIAALQLKEGVDPATRKQIADWLTNQQLMHTPIGQQLQQTRSELEQLKAALAQGQHQPPSVDVDGKLAAFQQEQAAREFVNTNPWLFTETNGVRVLSPEGFVYKSALEKAHQGGATFEMAKEFADLALAKHRSRQPAANGNGKPSPTTNPAAARTPAPAVPSAEQGYDWAPDGMDLNELLHRNLKRFNLLETLGQD